MHYDFSHFYIFFTHCIWSVKLNLGMRNMGGLHVSVRSSDLGKVKERALGRNFRSQGLVTPCRHQPISCSVQQVSTDLSTAVNEDLVNGIMSQF